MSTLPTQPPIERTETRRRWLLNRLTKLTREINAVSAELHAYEISFDKDEIKRVADQLFDSGSCVCLSPIEGCSDEMKASLPSVRFPAKRWVGGKLDAYTESIMQYLIENDQYYATGPDAAPKRGDYLVEIAPYIKDERIELQEVGIDMVLQPTDGDMVIGQVSKGRVSIGTGGDKVRTVLQEYLDKSHTMTTLPRHHKVYYLVVSNPERFKEVFNVTPPKLPTISNPNLRVSQSPSVDYIVKIGPRGKIEYRQDLSSIIKDMGARDASVRPVEVMHSISELAMALRSDDGFVYVCYK